MRIIALETSGRDGSLAALTAGADAVDVLRHVTLPGDQRTAQTLAPTLRDLLINVDWSPQEIELVAVANGPGSFTGLRIGVTTAKALAYAAGAGIVGVNTLEVLASQVPDSTVPLWTVMDAQRQELFAARFDIHRVGQHQRNAATQIVPQASWLAGLQPGDQATGPALHRLAPRLPIGVTAVPEEFWQPTAVAVGSVGWQRFSARHRDDVWKLAPRYYRPSAAEEKVAVRDT
jgi:tRNA threonylcarbamoyladenosine biosynthesis protein TsaB